MNVWIGNIEELTRSNTHFRATPHTGSHLQLTLMCIPPGESIGREIHHDVDQFLRIEVGHGQVEIGHEPTQVDERHEVAAHDAIIVPAGTWHDVRNTGPNDLKLYSIYAPPEHAPGTLHRTKQDALTAEQVGSSSST